MFGPYFWLVTLIFSFSTMFLFVPVKKIKETFSFGIYFGFLVALSILFVGSTLLNFWEIKNELIPFANFELILAINWIPFTIIFSYYLPKFSYSWQRLYTYIGLWATIGTIFYLVLNITGYWINLRWNIIFYFALSFVTHTVLAYYLLLRGNIRQPN